MEITQKEALDINGGAAKAALGVTAVVAAVVSFFLGFIDGYNNPPRCKSAKTN